MICQKLLSGTDCFGRPAMQANWNKLTHKFYLYLYMNACQTACLILYFACFWWNLLIVLQVSLRVNAPLTLISYA